MKFDVAVVDVLLGHVEERAVHHLPPDGGMSSVAADHQIRAGSLHSFSRPCAAIERRRITLIRLCWKEGGGGIGMNPAQRRFAWTSSNIKKRKEDSTKPQIGKYDGMLCLPQVMHYEGQREVLLAENDKMCKMLNMQSRIVSIRMVSGRTSATRIVADNGERDSGTHFSNTMEVFSRSRDTSLWLKFRDTFRRLEAAATRTQKHFVFSKVP